MDTDEALTLIGGLPLGSSFKAIKNPDFAWTLEEYRLTDVLDLLCVINWRMCGCPESRTPQPITRPGDAARAQAQKNKLHKAKQTIENTEWEVI